LSGYKPGLPAAAAIGAESTTATSTATTTASGNKYYISIQ
jgi:hypothetical protein